MAKNIGFVHIHIPRLILEFSKISVGKSLESKEQKDARIAEWARSLVHCLAKQEPSLNKYGALLIAEREAFKKRDVERKKKAHK